MIRYNETLGWHDAKVMPRGPLSIDPATAVLHYAQEIFRRAQGLSAGDGSMALFGPGLNAKRFRSSAQRLWHVRLGNTLFIESLRQIVSDDRDWFPDIKGARSI